MYCPECGTKNKELAKFCVKCGNNLKSEGIDENYESIEEQERARFEIQEKLKKEKEQKEINQGLIGCIGLIAVIAIIGLIFGWFSSSNDTGPREESITLNATIRYSENQLIITNNDSYNWANVTFEINPRTLRRGYLLEAKIIEAGQTYTVGVMQFAKPDGERFNPFAMKIQSISIIADTPRGRGYYGGTFQ